jgi:hypothetical protein
VMQVSEWQLQCAGRGASPPHIFPRRGLQPNSAPASRRHPPRRAASPYFEPSACLRGERCNGRLWLLRNIFVMRSLQQFDIFSQHFLLHYSLTHFTHHLLLHLHLSCSISSCCHCHYFYLFWKEVTISR